VYTYVGGYAGAWESAVRAEGWEKDALRSGGTPDGMRGPKMLSNAAARLSAVGGSPRLREGMVGRRGMYAHNHSSTAKQMHVDRSVSRRTSDTPHPASGRDDVKEKNPRAAAIRATLHEPRGSVVRSIPPPHTAARGLSPTTIASAGRGAPRSRRQDAEPRMAAYHGRAPGMRRLRESKHG